MTLRLYGIGLLVVMILSIIAAAVANWYADYQYELGYYSYWSLADKASTLEQKTEYIDQFETALENSGLQGTHDALFLDTPDNGFDNNLAALKSLQRRLHETAKMDVNSFAYQQAISQITSQEQGEAKEMLAVFNGCWYKVHHYYLWNDIYGGIFCFSLLGELLGGIICIGLSLD
jgi:hypothetical protein